ncbi:MAG: long-chain fatty acid--CoA ligase [bacterium]|nr:long-chain fatty acid--CoA ligase [bacterium]
MNNSTVLEDIMARDYEKEFEEFLAKEKTLAYMMLSRVDGFKDQIALRFEKDGKWDSMTWGEFGRQVRSIAKGLLELKTKVGDMIGIFAQNRPEWAISDLGILAIRGVSVPIYATNSAEEAEYIVNDAEVKIVFVGDQDQYDRSKIVLKKSKYLKKIVAMDRHITIEGKESLYFDEILEMGDKSEKGDELEKRLNTVDSEDMLTLIYTSGTTGNPKGAIHTHKSFMAGIYPSLTRFVDDASPEIVSLAILPLSHVFERMWSYGCMVLGIQIAYCPDPKKFVEVMTTIRPHLLTSVPRIWEKVYGTINEGLKTAPTIKRKLFHWSSGVALTAYRKKRDGKTVGPLLKMKHGLAKKLVISKVLAALGCDRNKIYHVGGAAFSTEINEFFQSFGVNIIQGYGLTEFFPVAVGFGDYGKDGACGPVIPLVQVRISDAEGEIQLKGLNAMKGYHKNEEATKGCFTKDGWYKTEDVGMIEGDELKYITITDRIKDLIITAGGKNISPQQIELLMGDELMVEQTVVVGEGRKYISALVVPSYELLEKHAKDNNISFGSRDDLANNPEIIAYYEKIIAENTKSLGRVEQIKKIRLLTEELTQENGELTPTMKLKRKIIREKYKKEIDSMYQE